MDINLKWQLVGYGHFGLTMIVAPALMLYWHKRRANKAWTGAVLGTVLVAWIISNIYRIAVELPVNIDHARSIGDGSYDGVGGNVATFMGGWIEPLFACMVVALVAKFINARKAKTEPADIDMNGAAPPLRQSASTLAGK